MTMPPSCSVKHTYQVFPYFRPPSTANLDIDTYENKHNDELQRADPGTKVTGQFSTRGRIFPNDAQNGFSLFSSF